MNERTRQLANNLRDVRDGIERACLAAGRDPASVTLLAVTKTWPVDDVRALAELGVADVGENRQSELTEKAAQTPDLGLRWHFVGQLQVNKARVVAGSAAVVHSVDRQRLVTALSAGAVAAGRTIDALVQVSLDGDTSRGGAVAADVRALAAAISAADNLRLAGVMAVAPLRVDPTVAYAQLAAIASDVRSAHPTASTISAGMSGDYAAAIRSGSTLVRVGTALLGGRPPFVG